MESIPVLLHPDLGEYSFDEVLVGLGTTLARLFFLPAIVPDEGDVGDVLPKELDLRIRTGPNGAHDGRLIRRLCSVTLFSHITSFRRTRPIDGYDGYDR